MPEEFKWPCDKRTAHGPHTVHDSCDRELCSFDCIDCPGVLAHPVTMIGGSYTRW